MKPENDQLAVLRRLRSEGRISKEEYEDLAGGLNSPGRTAVVTEYQDDVDSTPHVDVEDAPGTGPAVDGDDPVTMDDELGSFDSLIPPKLRENLTVNYVAGLALASLGLVVVSSLGMLSWLVTIPAILLFATTFFEGWRAVTVVGVVVWALILLVGLAFSVAGDPPSEPVVVATLPPRDPYPPVDGSLNVYMDQLTDRWNTVDAPPRIAKGLTRYNETGEYDTFLYRFGEWGRFAGAYDPANEALYALLITGQFSAEDTERLYLHLCYVVAPFSQDCIDSYREEGLDGGVLEDFTDVEHEAEWTLGDQTWRLEIAGTVMTIRVYGPDAA